MAPMARETCDDRRADPGGRTGGLLRRKSSRRPARRHARLSSLALRDREANAEPSSDAASRRARELADRLEQGARELAQLATALTDAQWNIRVPKDGRTMGVLVHQVASVYPLEVQLAQTVAAGQPVGVTLDNINDMHAMHAKMYGSVTKEAALDLLRRNSAAAAAAIRAMSDEQLDRVAPVPPSGNTSLSCQFVLEDHAVRQSYLQLARIQTALKAHDDALERLRCQLEA